MTNLAETLAGEGKFSEAEQLLRQTVDGKRRTMGPEHPSIFYSLDSLGDVLKKEKRYAESEKIYRQAFDGRSRVLGAANPDTAFSAYALACVLALEGKRDEAFTNLRFAVEHALSADQRKELETDSDLKPLRGDPRFGALLATVSQSAAASQHP